MMGQFALLLAMAQLSVGGVALTAADFLDGRAIADGTGAPVVMMTLTPAAQKRLKVDAAVLLDGTAIDARVTGDVIELAGQPDFEAAKATALALAGKPPLPETP